MTKIREEKKTITPPYYSQGKVRVTISEPIFERAFSSGHDTDPCQPPKKDPKTWGPPRRTTSYVSETEMRLIDAFAEESPLVIVATVADLLPKEKYLLFKKEVPNLTIANLPAIAAKHIARHQQSMLAESQPGSYRQRILPEIDAARYSMIRNQEQPANEKRHPSFNHFAAAIEKLIAGSKGKR